MHTNALGQLLILLASSVLVVTVLRRLKLPPVFGVCIILIVMAQVFYPVRSQDRGGYWE